MARLSDDEKGGASPPRYNDYKSDSPDRRKSSAINPDVLAGNIFDERFETTQRGLKSRHAQMIALGGTIGTGLFVGSGVALARGGPAFLILAFCIISFLVYCIVTAITEVAAYLPTPGSSMNLFAYRYANRSLGFSLGYLYFYSLGILVPYEITAAGLVIDYWHPPAHIAVWLSLMIVVIVGLNCFPVGIYGETEFWFAGTKVIMMLGLLIMSIVLFWGGGPNHDRLGFRYWVTPGATNTYLEDGSLGGLLAFLETFVRASFPFAFAPELLIVTGGEMESPRRNLPVAARRYFYRLLFFYIGSVIAISVICPYTAPAITSGGEGAGASPFVVGIKRAGIPVLDHIINGGILISAWSSGNSFLYLSSRSLYSLALSGNAPAFFKACTKKGVPYRAIAASSLFTLACYLNVGTSSAVVFDWFVNLTNTSSYISWIACAVVYLRFRKARASQGITDIPYKSWLQPWGSYCAIVGFSFLLLINGFDVFWDFTIEGFLTSYVGIFIFLAIFLGHRLYCRHEPWFHHPDEVDMYTGLEQVLADETPAPVYKGLQHIRVLIE